MIEESVKNSRNGVEIANEVGKVLEEIVQSVGKTTDLVSEIAAASKRAVDDILEQTAHVLAKVSTQIGVTLAPSLERGIISHIELMQVAERRLLVVLGVQTGLVRTLLLEVSTEVDRKAIESTQQALNERLAGQPLGSLRALVSQRLREDDPRHTQR